MPAILPSALIDREVARGVPPARITLMLSPKPVSQPLVEAWRQSWSGLPPHQQPRLREGSPQPFEYPA